MPEKNDNELYDELLRTTRARETSAHRHWKETNTRPLGEQRVIRQKWYRVPRTPQDRFTIKPTFSSKFIQIRIAKAKSLARWKAEYAHARESFRAGDRDAVFPFGTYALRKLLHVNVASPPQ